jgi:hypothetical protein
VPLAAVVLSIIGLAFVFILGTVVYGILLALGGWFADHADQLRLRRSPDRPGTPGQSPAGAQTRRALGSAPSPPGDRPVFSAEDMWARMQGTAPATSRKLRRRAPKP